MKSLADVERITEALLLKGVRKHVGKFPNIQRWKKDYYLGDNGRKLYRKQGGGQGVVPYEHAFEHLFQAHCAAGEHFSARKMMTEIKSKYDGSINLWMAKTFVSYCPVCTQKKPGKPKEASGSNPIETHGVCPTVMPSRLFCCPSR